MDRAKSEMRPVNPGVERYFQNEIWLELEQKLIELKKVLDEAGIHPESWFLHGSFVTNKAKMSSDIDIGVTIKDPAQHHNFVNLPVWGPSTSYGSVRTHRIELTAYDSLKSAQTWSSLRMLDYDERENHFILGEKSDKLTNLSEGQTVTK